MGFRTECVQLSPQASPCSATPTDVRNQLLAHLPIEALKVYIDRDQLSWNHLKGDRATVINDLLEPLDLR